jgi:sulfur-oxidizing protein SoxY
MQIRWIAGLVALVLAGVTASPAVFANPYEYDAWPGIVEDVFDDRKPVEGTSVVALDAPYRAEDAAIVPLTMTVSEEFAANVKYMWLIIDKNPAPVAAEFEFGPAAGTGKREIKTRVRVDQYSHVRAVVETDDGKLFMASKFVKAAGGCSAPALKDMDAALAGIGKMKVKILKAANGDAPTLTGQVMIKHPQYSGMQMNQVTGLYIPAKFITEMEIKRGSDMVMKITGGISLSEDPNLRFTYAAGKDDGILQVTAKDTDGREMKGQAVPQGS